MAKSCKYDIILYLCNVFFYCLFIFVVHNFFTALALYCVHNKFWLYVFKGIGIFLIFL